MALGQEEKERSPGFGKEWKNRVEVVGMRAEFGSVE